MTSKSARRAGVDGRSVAQAAGGRLRLSGRVVVGGPGGGHPGQLDDTTVEFAGAEAELVPSGTVDPVGLGPGHGPGKEQVREPRAPSRSGRCTCRPPSTALRDRRSFDAEGGSGWRPPAPGHRRRPARTPAERRADALVDLPVLPRPPADKAGGAAPSPSQRGRRTRRAGEGRGGRVIGGPAIDGPTISRLLCDASCTGSSQGTIGHPRLRHRDPYHPRPPVERAGHPRRALPLPRLRPASTWCEGHHVRWVTHDGTTELGISCCCAPGTTTASTNPTGRPSSCRTPPSRSPTPTAWCGPRHHRGRSRGGEDGSYSSVGGATRPTVAGSADCRRR